MPRSPTPPLRRGGAWCRIGQRSTSPKHSAVPGKVAAWIPLFSWSIVGHGSVLLKRFRYGSGAHAPGRCSNRSTCSSGNSTTEPYLCMHRSAPTSFYCEHVFALSSVFNCAFTYSNTKLQCSSRACSCCQHFSGQISKGRCRHRLHRRLRLVRPSRAVCG